MHSSPSVRSRAYKISLFASALAGGLLVHAAAVAQSTGSHTVDEVVVIAKKQVSLSGVITQVEAPKSKSIITQEYISTQQTGQNIIQDLNFVPGVSYTNDDPFGMAGSGGHLRIRGIDGSRISLLIDGVPLNDTGNYAIYPGELVDPEIISDTNVNIGSTDVDSPTASAVGGLININTLKPTKEFGGFILPSVGNYDYRRVAGLINTGEFGPIGTRAWIEASDQNYDKYKGYGNFKKYQINGKIYQPLPHEGDFVALAVFYDVQRVPNIYGLNLPTTKAGATIPGDPFGTDYLGVYYHACPTAGAVCNDNSPVIPGFSGPSSWVGNLGRFFYGNQVNPTDTYNIRGESKFTILPNVHLTVDPAFQSVLADGGSQANTVSETDPRLVGGATSFPGCPTGVKGVNLDGSGTCKDTVRIFVPSLTHTQRYTVNASLIWDINDDNHVRVSYAYDHGHHRQSGEAGYLNPNGTPVSVYGGYDSLAVLAADGSAYRGRDRLSIAILNQVSGEYIGRFFNQQLRVDLGLRAPFFDRDLNQYCYTSNPAIGGNGNSVYCDSVNPAIANPASLFTIAPYSARVHYSRVLPNVGLSWRFDPHNSVYFSYSEEFSAPRTDDLYTITAPAVGTVGIDSVRPETSTTFEGGYRYQSGRMIGSLALWDSEFRNRIVSTYDPNTGVSDDRNVGAVRLYGLDAQFGVKPLPGLTALATFEYEHSRLEQNVQITAPNAAGPNTPGVIEPLAGKSLVETPEITFGGRVTYEFHDFVLGFQGKYTGSRWTTDLNDQKVAGYTVFDLDARWKLDGLIGDKTFMKGTYVQVNVQNLFNKHYYGSLGTSSTSIQDKVTTNAGLYSFYSGGAFAYQGPPRTIVVSFKAAF